MSKSTPTSVTLASQFSGQHRPFPQQGGHVTKGELQSLATRLRVLLKTVASLAETVEQIRIKALHEEMDKTHSS